MRNIFLILTTVCLLFSSCEDFLEEKSQDLLVPKTTKDLMEFVMGETYANDKSICKYLDILTDDVSEGKPSGYLANDDKFRTFGYFTWQQEPERDFINMVRKDNAWDVCYHNILISNIVIDKIKNDVSITGSQEDKDRIVAECYFLKAYNYFMLVNLYGKPYNKATITSDLAVPINEEISIDDIKFVRSTIAEVYKKMEYYINESLKLFEKHHFANDIYRPSKNAAYILASRIYLFEEKYEETVAMCNKAIEMNNVIYNLSIGVSDYFFSSKNPEIVWSHGNYTFISLYNPTHKGTYQVSSDLLNLYSDDDQRKTKFFRSSRGIRIPKKYRSNRSVYDLCIRTSEAFLNRAEAYANIEGKHQLAVNDIIEIRKNRMSKDYTVIAGDKNQALELVKREKRMEFCFENQRWFDLRRWGMPKISHTFTDMYNGGTPKVYILKENDAAYTLEIPVHVRDLNEAMILNDRPERPSLNEE